MLKNVIHLFISQVFSVCCLVSLPFALLCPPSTLSHPGFCPGRLILPIADSSADRVSAGFGQWGVLSRRLESEVKGFSSLAPSWWGLRGLLPLLPGGAEVSLGLQAAPVSIPTLPFVPAPSSGDGACRHCPGYCTMYCGLPTPCLNRCKESSHQTFLSFPT